MEGLRLPSPIAISIDFAEVWDQPRRVSSVSGQA